MPLDVLCGYENLICVHTPLACYGSVTEHHQAMRLE
jgi:hypothetical protein